MISAMGAKAAGEPLPLFQPLWAHLPRNVATWVLNMRVATLCSAPGRMRVESRWGKR